MSIEPGMEAPQFELQDTDGDSIALDDLKGKKVVLYFYPKEDTPGCTIEAKQFSGLIEEFEKQNAVVYGISKDSVESHKSFTEKCGLAVPLLSDPGGSVCEAYGVLKDKQMFGNAYKGIERTTVLIDEDGKVAHVWLDVKPEGHAEDVLQTVHSS